MKTIVVLICAALFTGCAGLDVTYQLQSNYISKELAEKRRMEAAQLRAEQAAWK